MSLESVTPSTSTFNSQIKEYHLEEFKNLYKEIKNVDQWVNYAANNGLFIEINRPHSSPYDSSKQTFRKKLDTSNINSDLDELKGNIIYDQIQEEMEKARNNLEKEKYCEGRKNISKVVSLYNSALYSTTRIWRFINLYGGLVWIYLIGFLSLVLVFYVSLAYRYFNEVHGIEEAAIHAVTWGCIGGILRGIWYLKDKVSERRYKNSWWIFFLSGTISRCNIWSYNLFNYSSRNV